MRQQSQLIFILLCLGLTSSNLAALDPHKTLSQYTRSVWTQAQGLPQDHANGIVQTTDGYLWISTNEGLARFDGYEFTLFTSDDGTLPINSVQKLAAGADGRLWIATRDGLMLYQYGRFTTFTTKNGLPDNYVSALLEDHNGVLWVAAGPYLSRFEHGKFTNYSTDRLLPIQGPRALFEDAQHALWIAGVGGVVKLVNGTFIPVLGPNEMKGHIADAFVADADGQIWIGGSQGILVRSPTGQFTTYDSHNGLPDNLVLALWRDRDGNMWAGTNKGLARFEKGRFVASDLAGININSNLVRCLFEDREGDLWVGMESGLNRFRDDLFTALTPTEGFPSDVPVAVHQDRTGTVWIGYHGGGIVALEGGKGKSYTKRDGLGSDEIYAIKETRSGDLLISTRAGLSRLRAGHFSNYVVPDSLGRTVLFDAIEDHHGQLWAVGRGGVFEMSEGKFHVVFPGGPLIGDAPIVLANGLTAGVWAGAYGRGLWEFLDGQTYHFDTASGLSSNFVRSLYQDPDGTLWIGTFGGGLNALVNGRFQHFTTKEGLLSNNISHIEDDGLGTLWLSTTRGICRVTKQQLRDVAAGRIQKVSPTNYGVEDGLRSVEVAPSYPAGGGGTRATNGDLWFPTTRGIAVIDPSAHANKAPPLAIHISEVSVDGHSVDVSRPARINPSPGYIQFRFAAIRLSGSPRLLYEYKLEGLDQNWISAGTRRVSSYSRLSHGNYRFVVRASAPGVPSSEQVYNLEVLPHYYERQSFLWICAAVVFLAIYALYKFRLRQLHLGYSLVLEERMRLAREIHDTLSQGFVGIASQLNAVANRLRAYNHLATENLRVASEHLELARKMTRHSLTESQRSVMDLRASVLENRDLASALKVAAAEWAAGGAVHIDVQTSGCSGQFTQDVEQNVLRIAQEATTNALKHGLATRVTIRLQLEANSLRLIVKDDGIGFEPSNILTLDGGHFGIQGMRERAARIGGKLSLSTQPGNGTEVNVIIPVGSGRDEETRSGRPIWTTLARILTQLVHQ